MVKLLGFMKYIYEALNIFTSPLTPWPFLRHFPPFKGNKQYFLINRVLLTLLIQVKLKRPKKKCANCMDSLEKPSKLTERPSTVTIFEMLLMPSY